MRKKTCPLKELSHKVYFNEPKKNHEQHRCHASNQIKTGKYTFLTFIPKALYIQFLRLANVYFLAIAILSSIKEISPLNPVTSVIPLVFVLSTSMLREAIEDWGRHKNDRITNNMPVKVFKKAKQINNEEEAKATGGEFHDAKWKDIVIGDIVRIENDQQIPADIVLIDTSDENGVAYVETANVDGEKNLKLKQIKPEVRQLIQEVGLQELTGAMLVDAPNSKIQSFKGVMEINDLQTIYLNYNNIILRGTHLKNVQHVVGIVVYTGHETKIMQNQGLFRNKKSQIEKQLNKYIIGVFCAQVSFCILLSILAMVNYDDLNASYTRAGLKSLLPDAVHDESNQVRVEGGSFIKAFKVFASFMLLLNTMIPISLMVSLELAKFFQAIAIQLDDLLKEGDQRTKVLNMLIHEDLAKIDYIFADKTGTLTTNEMKFQLCSVNGKVVDRRDVICQNISQSEITDLFDRDEEYTHLFWLNLSLCHDVVIDKKVLEEAKPTSLYQGSSPDEVELVSTAKDYGYIFHEKKGDKSVLLVKGKVKNFLHLAKIDFSSDRKRMSVVVRDLEDNKLYLFCKGADSIIYHRLSSENPHELLEKTKEDLKNFSKEGLRTLAIAYKELDEEEFAQWQVKYTAAQQEEFNILCETEQEDVIGKLEEELEKDLMLLGATALEDKIQSGVAETISDFHKADIKVWMLTGDKLETAENIGYSTNLLAQDTKVFKIGTNSADETLHRFEKIQSKIKRLSEQEHIESIAAVADEPILSPCHATKKPKSYALIIDGEAINYTFNNDELKASFLAMIPQFRTVICCRSTPNQKADVVSFVRDNLKKMTLAIGDGGNDVNMIKRAHIGIGIFGKEGNQAAYASDYAIGKFSFLWRLLFVHGRWNYMRSSNFINFFFYKNLVFTLPQFWFALYSGFSGQSIYDNAYITNYNTIFTSVAPVYYAALEQDINPRENQTIRKAMPKVYAEFRQKNLFSVKTFLFWWLTGILHSCIIFFLTERSIDKIVESDGKTFDLWADSVTTLSGVFFSVVSIIFTGTHYFTVFTFVCYVILTFFAFFPAGTIILDQFKSPMQYVLSDIMVTPKVWPIILLVLVTCVLTVYVPQLYCFHFRPGIVELLQKNRAYRCSKLGKKTAAYETNEGSDPYVNPDKYNFDASIVMADWCVKKCENLKTSP